MNVRRTPGVVMIQPRVGPGLDGHKTIRAVFVGHRSSGASEVRVERRGMLVFGVNVTAGGVGLPNLNERARDRTAVRVEHAPGHNNSLAQRLAGVLAREVSIGFADALV